MAEENVQVVTLRDDFYRDRFGNVIRLLLLVSLALAALVALSTYLYLSKPAPITFKAGTDWRILSSVPMDQPYRSTPDMLQWVSEVMPKSFNFDFINYSDDLKKVTPYFTGNGWQVFLAQLNNYVNYNTVQNNKQFVSAVPASAPFVLNQGLITGRYGWWVQMPVTINYAGYRSTLPQTLTLQILVVRVSTLNNLSGIGIDNVIVVKNPAGPAGTTDKAAIG